MLIFSLSYTSISIFLFCTLVLAIYLYSYINKKNGECLQLEFEKKMMYEKEREISLHLIKLQHEYSSLLEKKDDITKELEEKKWQEKELHHSFFQKTEKLFEAQNAFAEEKKRIQQKNEREREKEQEEYARQWNDHEQKVLALLKSFSISPLSSFISYDNINLPECFEGKIKPDFCIQYNNKYMIFDAKKSKNMKSYIQEQAKSTAQKYADIAEVSKQIFFVVPDNDFTQLNKTIFNFSRFSIVVIPVSSIEHTLYLLSRMQAIENLSEINTEERENILHTLIEYKNHVLVQNSLNILMAEQSFMLEKSIPFLPEDFESKLNQTNNKPLPFSLQKAQYLAKNYTKQKNKITKMKTPPLHSV